jgi:hypothetical protein
MKEQKLLSTALHPPVHVEVRLLITRMLDGSIDGIRLGRFRRGRVYDVRTLLGCYLLAEGVAEPVSDDIPAEILPPEKQMFAPWVDVPARNRSFPKVTHPTVLPLATASDRMPRRRRTHKRR